MSGGGETTGRRMKDEKPEGGRRVRLYEIVFESDTRAGRTFDLALITAIVLSVLVVIVESVASIRLRWGGALRTAEWTFTVLFTAEYLLRLAVVRRPLRYARASTASWTCSRWRPPT